MTQCFNVCPRFLPLLFQQRTNIMLVQPAVCGIYDLPPLSSFFLFLFSSIEKRKSFFTPQRGVFCSSWKRGKRLRPTFLFLLREKKKRAAPGTKKKSAGSGFRGESCSFFVRALHPENECLGAVRTGFTTCAAAAEPYSCHYSEKYVLSRLFDNPTM